MEFFLLIVVGALAWWLFGRRGHPRQIRLTSTNSLDSAQAAPQSMPTSPGTNSNSLPTLEPEIEPVVSTVSGIQSQRIDTFRGTVVLQTSIAGWDDSTLEGAATPVEQLAVNLQYAFVLSNELPNLSPEDQWWSADTHGKFFKQGSDRAISWLEPFVPLTLAKKLKWKPDEANWGPWQFAALAREIRALIRQRRKEKVPHLDLLQALYGANVLASFLTALTYDHLRARALAAYLAGSEVSGVKCDYTSIGYKYVEGLGVTDVKWLVEAFGEPQSHLSAHKMFPALHERAISRYLWGELRRLNHGSLLSTQAMTDFLVREARIHLAIAKDSQARRIRTEQRNAYAAAAQALLAKAEAATEQNFIVAELSTTGRDYDTDEIQEFCALEVNPAGETVAEFSAAVMRRHGACIPLADALGTFMQFIGDKPIFLFNGYIPEGFLRKACEVTKRPLLINPVYDVMELAREALPGDSLALVDLAKEIGAKVPEYVVVK